MTDRPDLSSYLAHLPAIFQPRPGEEAHHLLGRFLLAFEQILSGRSLVDAPGLQEILGGIPGPGAGSGQLLRGIERYFDPRPRPPGDQTDDATLSRSRAPAAFLGWLAGWVGLSLRDDWSEEERRRFLARIVAVYRERGTAAGLQDLLRAYTGNDQIVVEEFDELASYFQVELALGVGQQPIPPIPNLRRIVERQQQIARALVEQEKPAHVVYRLRFRDIPTMQIGARSTVGVDTWLGAAIASAVAPPQPDGPRPFDGETIQVAVRSTVGVDTWVGAAQAAGLGMSSGSDQEQ